ncbi:hypothetical protein LBMAG53_20350 [Planctomycetota bacterium]|nr:hypothetical protein LBMAG53_20350 [Planctomycetota bacterium]
MLMAAEPVQQINVVPDALVDLDFIVPLLGFPKLTRYRLQHPKPGPLWWLESLQQSDVNFCLLAPFSAGLDWDLVIAPDDLADIGAKTVTEVDVFTVVVLHADPAQVRTNLRAPILVCRRSAQAKQLVLNDARLPLRLPLRDINSGLRF